MSRDRRRSPQLESLEGKRLLSAARFDHIVAHGAPMIAHAAPPLVLNGTMKGSLATFLDTPGPPETLSEVFTGRARSMGMVRAVLYDQIDSTSGTLLGGQVVLTNPRGSVHLSFGPQSVVSNQTVGNVSTQVVQYTVVQGTGVYAGTSGSGTFTVLQNNGKSSTLVFQTSGS